MIWLHQTANIKHTSLNNTKVLASWCLPFPFCCLHLKRASCSRHWGGYIVHHLYWERFNVLIKWLHSHLSETICCPLWELLLHLGLYYDQRNQCEYVWKLMTMRYSVAISESVLFHQHRVNITRTTSGQTRPTDYYGWYCQSDKALRMGECLQVLGK